MDFDTECRNVLLFEFSREMSLDERGLEVALAIAGVLLAKDEKVKRISSDRKSDRNNSLWGFAMADLSCSAITNKHKLEAGNLRGSFRHFVDCFPLAFAIEFRRAVWTRRGAVVVTERC
jgi:hypothetical protein